jgi:antitoxin ParD1/3/4
MPNRNPTTTPEQRPHNAALKLRILRRQIKAGVDALERGDFVEVDDADLDDFLQTAV